MKVWFSLCLFVVTGAFKLFFNGVYWSGAKPVQLGAKATDRTNSHV
jgi:hypothetical protein